MIKPDRWIREWGRNGGVDPFSEELVNSASYDIRVSDHWICPTRDPEEFRSDAVRNGLFVSVFFLLVVLGVAGRSFQVSRAGAASPADPEDPLTE